MSSLPDNPQQPLPNQDTSVPPPAVAKSELTATPLPNPKPTAVPPQSVSQPSPISVGENTLYQVLDLKANPVEADLLEESEDLAAALDLRKRLNIEAPFPQSSQEVDIDNFFRVVIAQRVSDVHLRIGYPPMVRKNGELYRTNYPVLDYDTMERIAQWLNTDMHFRFTTNRQDMDFSKDFESARLRVNMLYEMGQKAFVIRIIPTHIPTLDELGLPKVTKELTKVRSGLVLITGKAGNGKSTTLASMLDHINTLNPRHIVTIEDPVEYAFTSKRGIVTQRQIGIDTVSYPVGIRQALRQDPDVILIGEIRDRDTAFAAIKAAETGILVFSTLHTSEAIQTFSRIIHFFEPHERDQVRAQLANILRGIVCQQLYRQKHGLGRSAVAEILVATASVRDYLISNEVHEIYRLQEEGRYSGMVSLNGALLQLLKQDKITEEEALRLSNNPEQLAQKLRGVFQGVSTL